MCSETSGIHRFYDLFMEATPKLRATGRCLCGAVAYEVRGPMRDISICHCVECRRWSGYLGAFSRVLEQHLVVSGAGLRWIDSPDSDRQARRGFCSECGSSLFWQPADADYVNVAVGTLDQPTGLPIAGHWYAHQAGDWDVIHDDGLPRDEELSPSQRRWT
jgi:hypothetical protein